jgi:hypothetical protein
MPILVLPQPTAAQSTFPTDWPQPNTRFAVEFAPTAAPTDAAPVWTDVTADVLSFDDARGRQKQLDRFEAGTGSTDLRNDDRKYDPLYADGQFFGNLLPMRRWRIRGQYQDPRPLAARLDGSSGTSLSAAYLAAFQVTGDLDVRVRVRAADYTPGGIQVLASHWTSSNQNWQFQLLTGGTLQALYSTTGSNSVAKTSTATLASVGIIDGRLVWLRLTQDVDNGSAQNEVKFWYSTDDVEDSADATFTQLGSTVTTAGAITRFASTAILRLGIQDNGDLRLTGDIWRVQLYNGIAGTLVADFDPDDCRSTSLTSFTSTTGETWTRNGATSWLARAPINSSRFLGYAESYTQGYDLANTRATCRVNLVDSFKILALTKPASTWLLAVQTGMPFAWYRLSETSGSTMADSSAHSRSGSYTGTPTYGATGLVANDTDKAITFSGTQYGTVTSFTPDTSKHLQFIVAFSTSSNTINLFSLVDSAGRVVLDASVNASGNLVVRSKQGSDDRLATTTSTYNGGTTHLLHVYDFHLVGDTYTTLFAVNGAIPTTTSSSGSAISGTASRLYVGTRNAGTQNYTGTLDEMVVHEYDTVTADYAALYATFASPLNGDTSGERIDNVLDLIGWPTTERDIDTGSATLQSANLSGSVLDHLQLVAASEVGALFQAGDGRLTFIERDAIAATDSVCTFSDQSDGVRFRDLSFSYDDAVIRNSITAQRTGGSAVVLEDEDSIASYMRRSYSATDLLYDDDDQTRGYASWVLGLYAHPAMRAEVVKLVPARDPTVIYPAVFGLEIGDRVTVERTPQGVGDEIVQPCIVEGIREHADMSGVYEVELVVSGRTSVTWVLGDAEASILGDTTILGF